MPAFIKTPKDEKVWQDARQKVDDEYDYSENGDTYWKLVNSIYHKMRKNAELEIASELFDNIKDDDKINTLPDDIITELKQRNYIAKEKVLTNQSEEILKGGIDLMLDNLESLFKDYPESYKELVDYWNTNEFGVGTLYLIEDLENKNNITFKISLRF